MTSTLIFQLTDEEDLAPIAETPAPLHGLGDDRDLFEEPICEPGDEDGLFTYSNGQDTQLIADPVWAGGHGDTDDLANQRRGKDFFLGWGPPLAGLGQTSRRVGVVIAMAAVALIVVAIAQSARHSGRSSAEQRSLVAAAATATGQASLRALAASPRRGRWPISPRRPPAAPSGRNHRDRRSRVRKPRHSRPAHAPRDGRTRRSKPPAIASPIATPPPSEAEQRALVPVPSTVRTPPTEPTRPHPAVASTPSTPAEFSFER